MKKNRKRSTRPPQSLPVSDVMVRLLDTPEGKPIRALAIKAAKLSRSVLPGEQQLADLLNRRWVSQFIELAESRGEVALAEYLRSNNVTFEVAE